MASSAALRRLASSCESLTNFLEYDSTDCTELGRLIDDTAPHRYYYFPHTDEDMRGPVAASWRVCWRAAI